MSTLHALIADLQQMHGSDEFTQEWFAKNEEALREALLPVQMQRDADIFRKLQRILGYVENSSEQIVQLSHDDATRTVHLKVKGYGRETKERRYWGDSLAGAIRAAIDAGEGSE